MDTPKSTLPTTSTTSTTSTAPAEKAAPEASFQQYKSSRHSTRMITPAGKKIAFMNFQFITSDQECIDYLDAEIEAGIRTITKGEKLTTKEIDPMARLKAEIIAEHEAKKTKDALAAFQGKSRDMGSTNVPAGKIKASSTKNVAN